MHHPFVNVVHIQTSNLLFSQEVGSLRFHPFEGKGSEFDFGINRAFFSFVLFLDDEKFVHGFGNDFVHDHLVEFRCFEGLVLAETEDSVRFGFVPGEFFKDQFKRLNEIDNVVVQGFESVESGYGDIFFELLGFEVDFGEEATGLEGDFGVDEEDDDFVLEEFEYV